jgi:UDP-glucose 4,6-dehydratase
MILVLGATSYIGQAFARVMRGRRECFIPLSRDAFDYTRFELLFDYVRKIKPELVINAAEHGEPLRLEDSEIDRLEMLQANTLLPQTVSRVCEMTQTPWGQVSSGDIYCGAKISRNQTFRIERDLAHPVIRKLFDRHPEQIRGFTELDEPNFSFKKGPCTFYSGTKALAEEAIRNHRESYIWRLRLPFNEQDQPANFLSRLLALPPSNGAINSLSHLEDCVAACLQLWERRAPFGIYNVTNPGAVTTDEIITMIQRILKPARPEAWLNGCGSSRSQSRPLLRSDCILDASKLRKTGIELRNVRDALQKSLEKWQSRANGQWTKFPQPEPAAQ